jgi:type II secretion system protein H
LEFAIRNPRIGQGAILPRTRASQKGLTLIELTIVLLIVAILYTFASPKIRILTEVNLRTSARRLTETIRVVQSSSITHASQYLMRFNIDAGTYAFQRGDEIAPGRWQFLIEEKDKAAEGATSAPRETTFKLPAGVFFQDISDIARQQRYDKGEVRTEFSPGGLTNPMLIHLGDNKSRFYTLLVDRYGGRVTLRKGNLSYPDFFSAEPK